MNRIFTRLTELAACLCAEFEEDEFCFCGVIPGDAAVREYAGDCEGPNGMAWVRLMGVYPASAVGFQDRQVGNCGSSVGADVEVGIMRYYATVDDDGNGPSAAYMLEQTELQTDDVMAMLRAITCCDALPSKEYILGPYVPAGPMGGMMGGTFSLSLGF